ncbi:N-acetyltransferase [Arenibacter sp. TNZ]|uniref:GNAT family N-acetyltransferase n=1 Tax=Arenibacter TaxID=178469 RepID=UPI000CD3FDA8|nr:MULTISPECIES: GNAT family N-acetyltransferase [Arenibacter]MCM4172789.1 N-acetyltransferase [Arenibacter sp. TNZ]
MRIDLENIVVRLMDNADISGAMQLVFDENWNQTKEDWRMLLGLNSNLCLVAVYNGAVVGTVTAVNYKDQVAWIGMMLVSKNFRGLGISKTLLNTVIEKLGDCKSIKLDATPAGIPVYRKLGFHEELEINRMVTTEIKGNTDKRNIAHIKLISEDDIEELLQLDLKIFGADRFELINSLINRNGYKTWCILRNERIVGYVLGRIGLNFFQVGPLMAETVDDAVNLLETILEQCVGQSVVIDVLHHQVAFKQRLTSLGFSFQRSFTRMYLKNNSFSGVANKQFLIAGPELG